MADLQRLTVVQLKRLLLDESGTIPRKGTGSNGGVVKNDIIKAIINNRSKNPPGQEYLSNLPPELKFMITSGIPISDIPNLCNINKRFKEACLDSYFWSNYLNSTSEEPQEALNMLFIELAKHDQIDVFDYLWNTEIIIYKIPLIKERRSLYESIIAVIKAENDQMVEFIWSLDWRWMNMRTANKFRLVQAENYANITNRNFTPYYIIMLKLKIQIIEIIKMNNFKELVKLYSSETYYIDDINEATKAEILSYSPSVYFLNKAIKLFEYDPEVEDIYESILYHAAKRGNVKLFGDIEKISDKYDWLRIYFLKSFREDGIKLATDKFAIRGVLLEEDGDTINYTFGNKDIMLIYIKKYPAKTRITLMKSFRLLPPDELIDMFLSVSPNTQFGHFNENLSQKDWDEWIEKLNNSGYDYLLSRVRKELI